MNTPPSIDDIRNARDAALDALADAVATIGNQIAQTTTTGPFLDQLTKRYQDLMNERSMIRAAATETVLSLPAVIAAAAQLTQLSTDMKRTAQELSDATTTLNKATTILSLGQQFSDVLASASNT
ncbi:MAG TPA: hypothetical protein VFQ82_15325 [Stellaceae bacterium]|jgi:hypothetical protein|nr:hypothetical protein [Stellaceae bacterium]